MGKTYGKEAETEGLTQSYIFTINQKDYILKSLTKEINHFDMYKDNPAIYLNEERRCREREDTTC